MKPDYVRVSPRRGRLWDLRRCTMTPIMSAAPIRTTASTEKLVMAASFHTSGGSSTDLPGGRVTKQLLNGGAERQRQQAAGGLRASYMCCRRASWGTSCTTNTARKHPGRSSRTRSGCTDLPTGDKHPHSQTRQNEFNTERP